MVLKQKCTGFIEMLTSLKKPNKFILVHSMSLFKSILDLGISDLFNINVLPVLIQF